MSRELRIIRRGDGTIVHRVVVDPTKSERQVELVLRGVLRNLNVDDFYVEDSEDDTRLRSTPPLPP